jgi:hypothetical protein
MHEDDLPAMVSREQAAEFLGVTPQALSQMNGRGEGPPYARIGRSVRYKRQDLLDWVESRIVRP